MHAEDPHKPLITLVRTAEQRRKDIACHQNLLKNKHLTAGTLADLLSPARLVIFGTLLTTLNKPMFAGAGAVYASFGTVATLYWITAAKVRPSTNGNIFCFSSHLNYRYLKHCC